MLVYFFNTVIIHTNDLRSEVIEKNLRTWCMQLDDKRKTIFFADFIWLIVEN